MKWVWQSDYWESSLEALCYTSERLDTSNSTKSVWHAINVTTLPAAEEAVAFALMEVGALGTQTSTTKDDQIVITGFFESLPSLELTKNQLCEALHIYGLSDSAIHKITESELANRDWLAEWKKGWQPVEVGRFLIAPPWTELKQSDKIIIRIEPGMAFGTGTHETTRLCLKAIEKHFRGGSFLDVGAGTGILAIAAAKMFSEARVAAYDTDADAIAIARENARLNGVLDRISFRAGSVDAITSSADFLCANLTAPVIIELLPLLLGATCGRLVLSGILDSQLELVQSKLNEFGVSELEIERDGEWVSIVI